MNTKGESNILEDAWRRAKKSMAHVFVFSCVANLLLLTSPLFMLQVYDRVLLSRSESTLIGLLAVAVFLLVMLWLVEIVRNFLLNRISARFDNELGRVTFSEILARGSSSEPLRDFSSIRSFLNAPYTLSLFDVPWLPIYLAIAYALHPWLGHVGLVGALVLFSLAILNDRFTKDSFHESSINFGAANKFVEHSARSQDAVVGMGMVNALSRTWSEFQAAGLGFQSVASDRNATIGSLAKVIRQIIQVAVLAMGGYLAIMDITTAGVMIAASIIIGRALAPIEQSIQGWRALSRTRESYANLYEFLSKFEPLKQGIALPPLQGSVKFEGVVALADDQPVNAETARSLRPVIKNISFELKPGEALGVTGPSGAGKSTFIRLILGVLKPLSGTVRIDGAEMTKEVQLQFAEQFGFLPQSVGFYDGSVAENIARFRDGDSHLVIEAAKRAGAHELILSLPEGYETRLGASGNHLSGGQAQRIGLARALYGDPALVVLDEPTSNLDNEGRQAFIDSLAGLKERGATIILVAHQPSLFASMDKIALIANGELQKFGPAAEVFQELNPKQAAVRPPGAKVSPPRVQVVRRDA